MQAESESEDEEGMLTGPVRMTPMELDLQLQVAELVFRSMLEGKRLGVHPAEKVDEWQKEALGEDWCMRNRGQQREVMRQMRADGENTPMWTEALANMGDIAWEIFHSGHQGEMLRSREAINREEILAQLQELLPKVRDSHYARCGAGDRLYGLRALIAILHIFIRDAEVLELCAVCLRHCIQEHEANRDGVATLSVPLPPEARGAAFADRGWSFLRHALDALVVQTGGAPFGSSDGSSGSLNLDVALRLVECIVAAAPAGALQVQLQLLREEPAPEGGRPERAELQQLVPRARAALAQLSPGNHPAVGRLQELLALATGEGTAAAPEVSQASNAAPSAAAGKPPGDKPRKSGGFFGFFNK